MYYLLPSRRHTAYRNCEAMGITENTKSVVKSAFRHNFASFMESFRAAKITTAYIKNNVKVVYKGKIPENKGFFLVSAHFGPWELAPYIISSVLGVKTALIARKIKDPDVDAFAEKQRTTADIIYIRHRNAAEKIKECLQNNIPVGALLDHSSMPKDSISAPLFGIETTFLKGIPILSARSGYPILPAFITRDSQGFTLTFYPEITADKSLPPKERARDIAVRINKIYEEVISEHPDQWYLIHKRFKRVTGEDGNFISGIY
jgi:KDO2-lipid IV(A) lauroyltransferase